MKTRQATQAVVLGLTTLACSLALAQARTDIGKREFENNCAVCHASDAKGKGPYNYYLKTEAPDLTILARRNGGVFPVARVYDVIEGAGVGHGTRDMPVWGQAYKTKAAEYYIDVPYNEAAFVSGRILALIDHLNKLQVK